MKTLLKDSFLGQFSEVDSGISTFKCSVSNCVMVGKYSAFLAFRAFKRCTSGVELVQNAWY